jgi:hypothetical protein
MNLLVILLTGIKTKKGNLEMYLFTLQTRMREITMMVQDLLIV